MREQERPLLYARDSQSAQGASTAKQAASSVLFVWAWPKRRMALTSATVGGRAATAAHARWGATAAARCTQGELVWRQRKGASAGGSATHKRVGRRSSVLGRWQAWEWRANRRMTNRSLMSDDSIQILMSSNQTRKPSRETKHRSCPKNRDRIISSLCPNTLRATTM